jgi:hypothetical protein
MTPAGIFEDDDILELILTQLPLQDGISLLKTSKERYYNSTSTKYTVDTSTSTVGAKYTVDKAKTLVDNAYQKWSGVLNSLEQISSRAQSMRHMDILPSHMDHIMYTLSITQVKLNRYSDAFDEARKDQEPHCRPCTSPSVAQMKRGGVQPKWSPNVREKHKTRRFRTMRGANRPNGSGRKRARVARGCKSAGSCVGWCGGGGIR